MIRFEPDTWRDALLRPLAMASPDGGVYVEIIAPDFRFVFIIVLALACLILARRRLGGATATPILLAITAVAFVPWLVTSGNGRYFIPFLLIAGPLCIGLLHQLPVTRSFRMAVAVGIVLWQAFLIHEVVPWRYWGHVVWDHAPAFEVQIPEDLASQPATYVTLASISYSLIAPRFHPDSHWTNISSQAGVTDNSPDGLRVQALIARPGPLRVLFPTVPGGITSERIDPSLADSIDDLLARQGISIEDAAQCRLLRSAGLAAMASRRVQDEKAAGAEKDVEPRQVHGFWLCPLVRHASPRATKVTVVSPRIESVFDKLERLCPRIFRAGEAVSLHIPGGAVRGYPGSDFKLYVFEHGAVWYKYYRALNGGDLGTIEEVLRPEFKMDCDNIRGRSGLPWERSI